jgi:chemotaxis protein histidine kinase CheA
VTGEEAEGGASEAAAAPVEELASTSPNDIEPPPPASEEEEAAPASEEETPAAEEPNAKVAKAAAKAAEKAAAKAEKTAAKEKAKADKVAAKMRAQEEKTKAKADKEAAKEAAKSTKSAPPVTPEPQAATSASAVTDAEAPENADVESPVAAVGVAAGIAAAVAEAAAGVAPVGAPAKSAADQGEDEGGGKGDGKGEGEDEAGSAGGEAGGDEDEEENPKDDFVIKVSITPAAPGKKGISRQGSIYMGGKRIKCAFKFGRKAAKWFLIATNCLFFALALGLIGIGGYALGSTWGKFFDLGVLVGCIVVGVFLSMVAFFGCVGAVTLRRQYLTNYIALTTVIFVVQVIQTLFTWKLMKTVTTTQDQGFDEATYDASQRAVVGTIRSVIGSAFEGGSCAVVPAASPALSVACSDTGSGWFVDFVGSNCNTPTASATFQKCNATSAGGTAKAYDPVYCACRGALFDQLAKYSTHISAISVSLCVFEFLLVCAALRLALSKKGKARAVQDKARAEERRERRASLKSERAAVQTEKKAAAAERKEHIAQLELEAQLASAAQAVRTKNPPANARDEPPSAAYAAAHAANNAANNAAAEAAEVATEKVTAVPASESVDAGAGAGAIVDLYSAKVQV